MCHVDMKDDFGQSVFSPQNEAGLKQGVLCTLGSRDLACSSSVFTAYLMATGRQTYLYPCIDPTVFPQNFLGSSCSAPRKIAKLRTWECHHHKIPPTSQTS